MFVKKTFADCSLVLCQRTPRLQILWRKLSQIYSHKTTKFVQVFSFESFPLYSISLTAFVKIGNRKTHLHTYLITIYVLS